MIVTTGGGKLYAVIGATYPAGSTCTCTNGTRTIKAKDTSGSAVFKIPRAGTWTVSCTNGERTKSETVSITAEGQFATVELVYELWLYNLGNEYESVTGGWTGYTSKTKTTLTCQYTNGPYQVQTNYTAKTTNTVDFSKYKTLNIHIVSLPKTAYNVTFAINNSSGKQMASKSIINTLVEDATTTIDVSDFADTVGTVVIYASGDTDSHGIVRGSSVTFDKVWFSPE